MIVWKIVSSYNYFIIGYRYIFYIERYKKKEYLGIFGSIVDGL